MKNRIVGIASLPDREDCLKDTIESLYDQVDKIIVGLNNYQSIPTFLNREKIECHLLDNSLGDAAKFLKIEDYPNDYYFACDDDLIYPESYCELMINRQKHTRGLLGVHGVVLLKTINSYYRDRKVYHFSYDLPKIIKVDVVGTGCCLIDTSILKVTLSDFKSPNMADIWLADLAKSKKIKIFLIERPKDWIKYNPKMKNKITIHDISKDSDELQTKIVSSWKI